MNKKKLFLIISIGYEVSKALCLFFFVTLGVFLFIHWMPGSQADSWYIESGTTDHENQLIVIKYFKWLFNAFQLDFGSSNERPYPVIEEIYHIFPVTVYLLLGALLVSFGLSLVIGVFWATRESNFFVQCILFFSNFISSIPIYLLGMGAITLIFLHISKQNIQVDFLEIWRLGQIKEQTFPLSFIMYLIPPTLLGIGNGNLIELSAVINDNIRKILNAEYIKAVRARGASVTKHVARNFLSGLVSLIDARITYLISGAVIIENVFFWEGMGKRGVDAAIDYDYPVLMALVLMFTCIVIFVRIFKVLFLYLIDPRARTYSNLA